MFRGQIPGLEYLKLLNQCIHSANLTFKSAFPGSVSVLPPPYKHIVYNPTLGITEQGRTFQIAYPSLPELHTF